MTKAENRAAAKAYQEEKLRKWREEAHAAAVVADLEQLAALRKYRIFGKKAGTPAQELIDAIDDYVERLTGDRRALHTQGHSIGDRIEVSSFAERIKSSNKDING
jgi:hypothetical protein